MGRGKKKNKKGSSNIAILDDFSNTNIVETNNLEDDFCEVISKKNKPPKKEIVEKNIKTNKEFSQNIKKQHTHKTLYDKYSYINNFMNENWCFVGKYYKTDNIILEPESDDEENYIYDEY